MIDLHVHTWRCRHAEGHAPDYVRAACARGVSTLAFTEHLPLAPTLAASVPGADGYAMPAAEFPLYVEEVREAAELGRGLGVEVLLGVEVDAVSVALDHAREVVARWPFDIVLGSVHFIDGWAFDDPARTDGYAAWDIRELWERYFDDVVRAARAGIADVIGHVDLVKKFGARPDGPLNSVYRSLARELAAAGVAVEVNSAGLRKPCAELYPAQAVLEELFRAGVPCTIGSDAHAPGEVGAGLDAARAALAAAGYRSVLVFRNRVAEEVGIDEL